MMTPGEIGRASYELVPDLGGNQLEKYEVGMRFGRPIGRSVVGFSANFVRYKWLFNETPIEVDLRPYTDFYRVQAGVFYGYRFNDSWSGMIRFSPGIMSNLRTSLSGEDWVFNTMASATRQWGDTASVKRLVFGIGFGTLVGTPRLFPVISYGEEINDAWSYILGFPQTQIVYQPNPQNQISLGASPDGLYGNNGEATAVDVGNVQENTKLRYAGINTGLRYRRRLDPNWTAIINSGYTIPLNLEITDADNTTLYDLNAHGSFYITMGLSFNLNMMNNEENSNKR